MVVSWVMHLVPWKVGRMDASRAAYWADCLVGATAASMGNHWVAWWVAGTVD